MNQTSSDHTAGKTFSNIKIFQLFKDTYKEVAQSKIKCTNGTEEGSFGYCRKLQQKAAERASASSSGKTSSSATTFSPVTTSNPATDSNPTKIG